MKETALVTGATSGIGFEFAKLLAADGYNLVLIARDTEKLQQIKTDFEKKYNVTVIVKAKDLSVPDIASEIYTEVGSQNIEVEILINNAGFGDFGFFAETQWEKEKQMMNVNMMTLTHLTKLFLPEMLKRKKGKILNLASTAAFQPGPLMAVYYATKAYVLSFSQALQNEYNGTGVTVTALCPGPTNTGFEKAANLNHSKLFKNKKLPSAAQVAAFGYEAMKKGKTVGVYGFYNNLLIFIQRFLPKGFVIKVVRNMQEQE